MQTILGAGGAIGIELAKSLTDYTSEIRLVGRNPKKVNSTDELFTADLTNKAEIEMAIAGSSVVYVTIGFPYNLKIWRKNWPAFMQSVIEACIANQSKLVFFDNIYMYDPQSLDGMTEDTPMNPSSEKGKVRKDLVEMIMNAVESGKLTALIARSADFYGPSIKNVSMLTETVIKPLSEGKTANWMGPLDFKHSFTHVRDAGKATALLGNTPDAYNQTWHLPTASDPYTGKEWIEKFALALGVKPKSRAVSRFMAQLLGVFVPVMREMPEMMYQYDRPYDFNSDKFINRFGIHPTPYDEGIREIVAVDYPK